MEGRMTFSLIVCTYKRAAAISNLMESVLAQRLYPNEILIIDGSPDDDTKSLFLEKQYPYTQYFKVPPQHLGLTRQRNYGIERVAGTSDVICFLDDDIVLEEAYFENIIGTYQTHPDALGVGGYILEDAQGYEEVGPGYAPKINEFYFDGWKKMDGSRFILRKKLGLDSNRPPGFSPVFSHGRGPGFLPPNNKVYEVEQLMGGVSSFRRTVFDRIRFSTYFEGYGLYEDADFSIRVAKTGKLYVNTAATLHHHHDEAGRPNKYSYGKMVVRNGWYVWRVKNPNPDFHAALKWNMITILLTIIRFTNTFTTSERKAAFTEALGRTVGWLSIPFNKPKETRSN